MIQFSNEYNNDSTATLLVAADGVDSNFSKLLYPANIKDNGRINIKAVVQKSLFHKDGITYSYFHGEPGMLCGTCGGRLLLLGHFLGFIATNHVKEGTSLDLSRRDY